MKVFITGISGFIGQYLSTRLQSNGYTVYGLYQTEETKDKNDIPEENKFVADLMDKDKIEAIISEVKPDFVIHLAAKTEVALSFDNYIEVSQVNYVGTVILAEANRKLNPNLKLFLMASTMETYGHQDKLDGAFTELTEQKPMAPYAVAKLAAEKYLKYMRFAYSFPATMIRQTNAYGRTDNDFFVVERIITQMLSGNVCNLGEPKPIRNFLYIDDLIDLYMAVLTNVDKAKDEIFVTGPDNALTIEELANEIKSILKWDGTINWHTIPQRPGEIFYLNSNPAKAQKVLGWKPKVFLHDGLKKTIKIWETNNEPTTSPAV